MGSATDDIMQGMMVMVAGFFALFWAWFFWQLSTLMGLLWLLLCLITLVVILAHDEGLADTPRVSTRTKQPHAGVYIENFHVHMQVHQPQKPSVYRAPKQAALAQKIIDV